MIINIEAITGRALEGVLSSLAQLRMDVFRDFPYLYEGSAAYESAYLQSYSDNPRAFMTVARDGDRIVGAATAMPLADHQDASQLGSSLDCERYFYLAESVLLPAYRGRGIGHVFFDQREAEARRQGFEAAAFCAVQRPADHPARPKDYRPLEAFWRKRLYRPLPGVTVTFEWTDIGEQNSTEKTLQVWSRPL